MSKLLDVTNSIVEDVENEPDVNLETDEEEDNESNTDASVTSGSQSGDDATDDDETEDEAEEPLDDDEAVEGAKNKGLQDGDGEEDEVPKISKQSKSSKKKAASSRKNMEDDLTLLGVPHGLNFDDDEDEDSDDEQEDEEYFQKLKSDVRQNFAEIYHPESFSNNYDEIQTLSKVIRNSAGVIIDDLHRTVPFMTKYEKTRILGQRAKQLNEGAPPLIKIDSTVIDGYLIAVKELEQKKTPFIIRRPLPNGGSEYWRVQDLEIL